ncbi:MAG: hypothetical protein HYX24_04500 [Candidatus Aenigmarchaeota archaeon]|nr:hypothetical protein [Candidatus Aenigmarchaeota archaeon]
MEKEKVLIAIKEAEEKARKNVAGAETRKASIVSDAVEKSIEREKAETESYVKQLAMKEQKEKEAIKESARDIIEKGRREADSFSRLAKRNWASSLSQLGKEFEAFLRQIAREG